MKQRIGYIDQIKGFAILLVVMGHVIATWFDDYAALLDNDPHDQLLVWKLIYSFHMPLFMFCSGLFQPSMGSESTLRDVWGVVLRRFRVLMVPYFASGLLLWFVSGSPQFYWFLLVLFEFTVLNLLIGFAASRFPKWGDRIELAMLLAVCLLVRLVTKYGDAWEHLPLIDIGHLSMYRYFTAGYIVMKYGLIDRLMSKPGYAVSVITFAMLFTVSQTGWFTIPLLQNVLMAFAAIYAVFYMFRTFTASAGRPLKAFDFMGRHSLEIYILHGFFLSKVPSIGRFILEGSSVGGGRFTFVAGIVLALAMSAVCLLLCYLAWQVLKPSDLLSQLFLGRKYK